MESLKEQIYHKVWSSSDNNIPEIDVRMIYLSVAVRIWDEIGWFVWAQVKE